MKKLLALAVAGTMAVSLAACGSSASSAPASSEATSEAATSAAESAAESVTEATQGGKVGVCIYKFDDAFMTTYRNALQEILEGKGYEVTIVDGNNDQAKQNEQINTFVTQGVDALIINPVMTSAADQIISTVKNFDVPTVLINREPTADQMSAYDKLVYVGCDAAQSGTFQGALRSSSSTGSAVTGTVTRARKSARTTLLSSAIRSKLSSATTTIWLSALCRLSRLPAVPSTRTSTSLVSTLWTLPRTKLLTAT